MIVTDPFFHDWTTRIDCGGDAVDDDDGDPSVFLMPFSLRLKIFDDDDEFMFVVCVMEQWIITIINLIALIVVIIIHFFLFF